VMGIAGLSTPKVFANSSPGLRSGNPGTNGVHSKIERNPVRVALVGRSRAPSVLLINGCDTLHGYAAAEFANTFGVDIPSATIDSPSVLAYRQSA
jgi:hypothetical protein